MGKELPEDEELSDFLDADIPGMSINPERSFDFVTSEVRTQLAHLPLEQVDETHTAQWIICITWPRPVSPCETNGNNLATNLKVSWWNLVSDHGNRPR